MALLGGLRLRLTRPTCYKADLIDVILAMDCYNRGDGAAIEDVVSDASPCGTFFPSPLVGEGA